MEKSTDNQILHDWVIRSLVYKYSRVYSEVNINIGDEKNHEVNGYYPDAVFVNYGQIIQIVEVETKDTINEKRVEYWNDLMDTGYQLVILVPKDVQNEMRDLCWKNGLSAKLKIGTYDFSINI